MQLLCSCSTTSYWAQWKSTQLEVLAKRGLEQFLKKVPITPTDFTAAFNVLAILNTKNPRKLSGYDRMTWSIESPGVSRLPPLRRNAKLLRARHGPTESKIHKLVKVLSPPAKKKPTHVVVTLLASMHSRKVKNSFQKTSKTQRKSNSKQNRSTRKEKHENATSSLTPIQHKYALADDDEILGPSPFCAD